MIVAQAVQTGAAVCGHLLEVVADIVVVVINIIQTVKYE